MNHYNQPELGNLLRKDSGLVVRRTLLALHLFCKVESAKPGKRDATKS